VRPAEALLPPSLINAAFAYLLHRVPTHEVAEDLLMDAVEAALKGMAGFRRKSTFATWLLSICRNKAADWYRRQPRQAPTLVADESPDVAVLEPYVPALVPVLDDPDAGVGARAAWALERLARSLHDEEAVKATLAGLTEALAADHEQVRWAAAFAFETAASRVGDTAAWQSAIPALIDALGEDSPRMRWVAAKVLAAAAQRIEDHAALAPAVPPLTEALRDQSAVTRREAAHALRSIGTREAEAALAAHHPQPPNVIAASTFDAGDEGWGLCGAGINITHEPQGGHPGGYLSATIEEWHSGYNGWQAPDRFLGDVSRAYGGALDFELRCDGNGDWTRDDGAQLVGGGLRLGFTLPYKPGTDWTPYSIDLHESAGWLRITTESEHRGVPAPPASKADLLTVLSNLEGLHIRANWAAGWPDVIGLDNVILNAGPVPP
jgi:RNA polymerase sigma factor (sigma-70 family)